MTRLRCAGWIRVPGERPRRCLRPLDLALAAAGYSTHPCCGPDEPWNPPRPSGRAAADLRVNENALPRPDLTFEQVRAEVSRARADAQAGLERVAAARLAAAGCTGHATGIHLARWREAGPEAG